jgi:hypothetical protein
MDTARDNDLVTLEKIVNTIGTEPEVVAGIAEGRPSWHGSSVSTLQGSRRSSKSFEDLNPEAHIKPSLHNELKSRNDMNDLEALPLNDRLPDVKRLAWSRYIMMNIYRRLFSLVSFGNLAAFIWVIIKDRSSSALINAAAANLLALGLARQPLVVNFLFTVFGAIPRSAPLRLRRLFAKIYCYGGVHSGCGIASFFWYASFVILRTQNFVLERHTTNGSQKSISSAVLAISYTVLMLLLAIIISAHPKIRFMLHDSFELTHRFCGWAVVALFWPLLILSSIMQATQNKTTLAHILVRFPTFWMLVITTIAIIHPWLLLRRVKTVPENISSHAIRLHFNHISIEFGQAIQLAKNPLRDWHSFATFPDLPVQPGTTTNKMSKEAGFSCLVSKAGDWTTDTIQNPPTHLWKRGVPQYGFAHMMQIFSRLIVVTTGSGIGPCLSFLVDPNRPAMRVVWQTKDPLATYGEQILNKVHQLDANAVILETRKLGRVDMLPLVARLVSEFDAEAVCVISNPLVTKKLVFGCESRGIPAYGPIFDS